MRHKATINVKGTYTGEEMGEEVEEEEERWGKKMEEERKKRGALSAKLYKVLKRRDMTSQNEKWLFGKISRE